MPRPKTKLELLELSEANYKKLKDLVHSYPIEQRHCSFPAGSLNRNIKDVFAHLHEWHMMMLEWYTIGMSGEKPHMPAKGYTWRTLPALNQKIWEKHQFISFDHAESLLEESYQKIRKIIQQHSNEELFEKKRYGWTGSTSLGAYLISNTSSHYDWAYKLIKKSLKQ